MNVPKYLKRRFGNLRDSLAITARSQQATSAFARYSNYPEIQSGESLSLIVRGATAAVDIRDELYLVTTGGKRWLR